MVLACNDKDLEKSFISAVELQEWRHPIKSVDPEGTGEERHRETRTGRGWKKRSVININ